MWRERAVCRDQVDLMFAGGHAAEAAALQLCARCPVRAECLAAALESEGPTADRFGVAGGLTAVDRDRVAHGRAPRLWHLTARRMGAA